MSKSMAIAQDLENVMKENQELKEHLNRQDEVLKAVERERDFYFGKLRDIELLLAAKKHEPSTVVKSIEKVLLAREDDDIEVDEDGNLVVD